MSGRLLLLVLPIIGLSSLIACAPSPSGTGAPEATRTSLSLPPQPTAPPVTARAATPFASATFAPIVAGTPIIVGTPPTLAPTAAVATATPTRPAATPTQAAGTGTGARAEVKFDFVTPLGTAELLDDVRDKLLQVNGIVAVSGNETAVTIVYNPALITVDQIRQRLAGIGNPVKP